MTAHQPGKPVPKKQLLVSAEPLATQIATLKKTDTLDAQDLHLDRLFRWSCWAERRKGFMRGGIQIINITRVGETFEKQKLDGTDLN